MIKQRRDGILCGVLDVREAKSDEKFFHVMVFRDETILKQILILYFSLESGLAEDYEII